MVRTLRGRDAVAGEITEGSWRQGHDHAVSEDSDDKPYQQFVRQHNVDLLTIRDTQQKTNEIYGTFKFPETYVVDRSGKIVRKFIGAQEWTSPDIVEYLQKL